MGKHQLKKLPFRALEDSPELSEWLSHISPDFRTTISAMLLSLKFVSYDEFARWIKLTVENMANTKPLALYSLRKLPNGCESYWDSEGRPLARPGSSQGSEDFVSSVISSLVKGSNRQLLDHPGLEILQNRKIRKIIFIDDGIGSGDRVIEFLTRFFANKKLKSWWSYGLFHIYILAFSRNVEAENEIIKSLPGSNHHIRKFPKNSKVHFVSEYLYNVEGREHRWGSNFPEVFRVCKAINEISKTFQMGYGDVMSNLIFYHSIPNNVPGLFWCQARGWTPLFTYRSLPQWFIEILDDPKYFANKNDRSLDVKYSDDLIMVLDAIKTGIRSIAGISLRVNFDSYYVKAQVERGVALGLLSGMRRLTPVGHSLLRKKALPRCIDRYDWSLYTPKSWCTD